MWGGDLGVGLTRGFSCRSGRNVEKSLLTITYVVGIALCREVAADRCGSEGGGAESARAIIS